MSNNVNGTNGNTNGGKFQPMSANQRFVLTLVGMTLCGIAISKVSPAQDKPTAQTVNNVVRTQRVEITDQEGRVRVVIGSMAGGASNNDSVVTGVSVLDTDGKIRASMGIDKFIDETPKLSLYDSKGAESVEIYTGELGNGINVSDGDDIRF
jgi:hypothetical protein